MFDLNFIAREIAQREAKIEKLIAEIKEFQCLDISINGNVMSYADWVS